MEVKDNLKDRGLFGVAVCIGCHEPIDDKYGYKMPGHRQWACRICTCSCDRCGNRHLKTKSTTCVHCEHEFCPHCVITKTHGKRKHTACVNCSEYMNVCPCCNEWKKVKYHKGSKLVCFTCLKDHIKTDKPKVSKAGKTFSAYTKSKLRDRGGIKLDWSALNHAYSGGTRGSSTTGTGDGTT